MTTPITEISARLSDNGGSGVSLTLSTIKLTRPDGVVYYHGKNATQTNDGVSRIILTLNSPQSINGTYTIHVTAVDNRYNSTGEINFTFTLQVSVAEQEESFAESIKAYPQPATQGYINIAYDLLNQSRVKIEIYNLLGELVFDEDYDDMMLPQGPKKYVWSLMNEYKKKVAPGVYIYRIKTDDGSNVFEVTKKMVVIK